MTTSSAAASSDDSPGESASGQSVCPRTSDSRAEPAKNDEMIIVWRPDHRKTAPRRGREAKRSRSEGAGPPGGSGPGAGCSAQLAARAGDPSARSHGPIVPIRSAPTKNVASGLRIMIWRGPRQRRRRRNRPRLTRIHPSPSFSSFVRCLRSKPTNADSCAIAVEASTTKMLADGFEIHRKRAQSHLGG